MLETIKTYATIALATFPWLILIHVCIFGGQVSFESKGLIKQVKELVITLKQGGQKP